MHRPRRNPPNSPRRNPPNNPRRNPPNSPRRNPPNNLPNVPPSVRRNVLRNVPKRNRKRKPKRNRKRKRKRNPKRNRKRHPKSVQRRIRPVLLPVLPLIVPKRLVYSLLVKILPIPACARVVLVSILVFVPYFVPIPRSVLDSPRVSMPCVPGVAPTHPHWSPPQHPPPPHPPRRQRVWTVLLPTVKRMSCVGHVPAVNKNRLLCHPQHRPLLSHRIRHPLLLHRPTNRPTNRRRHPRYNLR